MKNFLKCIFFLLTIENSFCDIGNINSKVAQKVNKYLIVIKDIDEKLIPNKMTLVEVFKKMNCRCMDQSTFCKYQTAIYKLFHQQYYFTPQEMTLIKSKLLENDRCLFQEIYNNKDKEGFYNLWDIIKFSVKNDTIFVLSKNLKFNEKIKKQIKQIKKQIKTPKSQLLSFFKNSSASSNGDQIKENIIALASCEESFSDEEISEIDPIITDYVNNSEDKDPIFEEIRKNGLFVPDFSEKKDTCSIQ